MIDSLSIQSLDQRRQLTAVHHAADLCRGVTSQLITEHRRRLYHIFTTQCNCNALYGENQARMPILVMIYHIAHRGILINPRNT